MRKLPGLLAVAVLATGLSGCARPAQAAPDAYVAPAQVVDIPGSQARKVTLTALAVQRLDIRTTPVASAGKLTAVPVPALVYDPEGRGWVYTNPVYLTYLRVPVTVDHVAGDLAVLRSGPATGTPVVAVGAQELLGTEYGVGEE